MTQRGKYVVIEGPDGTGKSTQADLLAEHLNTLGIDSIHVKEPGGTPIGEELRKVVLNGNLERSPMTNLLIFTAIRHELWHNKIVPTLEQGTWVICTRNYWSSLAFQGYGEGMDIQTIARMTAEYTDPRYMHPDIGIILNFQNEAERARRIAARGALEHPDTFESRPSDFQMRVNNAYTEIAKDYSVEVIDASKTVEEIFDYTKINLFS